MNLQSPQHAPDVPTALDITLAAPPPRPVFLTVDQFARRNPAFTRPALRNLIFKAEARQSSRGLVLNNGLKEAGAVLRVGRKVLIDEARFFAWVRSQNEAR